MTTAITLCFITLLLLTGSYWITSDPHFATTCRDSAPNQTILTASDAQFTNWTGRIAIVKSIFSTTAYTNAFYVFYSKYGNLPPGQYVNSSSPDLHLLNRTIVDSWGWSSGLYAFLASDKARLQGLVLGDTMTIIDEINVTCGGLFDNGQRRYDVLILGFTEYVTAEEYEAYWTFVATGGTMILMDACNFLAEVKYYPPATLSQPGYLSLVRGHGWTFNGTHACKDVYQRWSTNNTNWVGGNYWRWWYGRHYDYLIANTSHPVSAYLREHYGELITTSYGAHEENLLENLTASEIIGYWNFVNASESPGVPVAAYQHRYVNGSVYHSGIMASDRVAQEEFLQAFIVCIVRLTLNGEVGEWVFHRSPTLQEIVIALLGSVLGLSSIVLLAYVRDAKTKHSGRHKPKPRN